MQVKHFSPSVHLKSIVASFWTLQMDTSKNEKEIYRLIPDTSVDWIFHHGEPWCFRFPKNDEYKKTAASHLFGHMKNYVDVLMPKDKLFLFGIKFHPWTAQQLWKINMNEVTDQHVALSDLNNPALKELEEKIFSTDQVESMIDYAEDFILKRCFNNKENTISLIIKSITKKPLTFYFDDLTISKRRIEQRFKKEIGISPKRFQRTIRINHVIQTMINSVKPNLTDLAYQFDYHDQSHFIYDFKQFTNCSPSVFIKSIAPQGDFFNFKISSI